MAEDYRTLVKQLCFDNKTIPYGGSKTIIFHNVLGAVWTIEIFFCQRFGLMPIDLPSKRLMLKLKCENLKRKVYVKTKIRMVSNSSAEIKKEKIFHNYIITGDSFLELVIDFEIKPLETVHSLKVSGDLNIYTDSESYFYYKQKQNMCLLPEESQLETIHLQMMRELSEDFLASMSEQEHTSDVVLRCESDDFKAHKFVLSARSKVFSAMFQSPMKESETDVMEIQEMSSENLKDVLEYIYSGKITEFNDKKAYELVPAAEKYDLPGLKRLCVHYIQSELTPTNALRTLTFAKLYDEDLKNKTIDYVCVKFELLKNTEEWDIFKNEEPLLANEVLSNMFKLVNSDEKRVITRKKHPCIFNKKIINHLS